MMHGQRNIKLHEP